MSRRPLELLRKVRKNPFAARSAGHPGNSEKHKSFPFFFWLPAMLLLVLLLLQLFENNGPLFSENNPSENNTSKNNPSENSPSEDDSGTASQKTSVKQAAGLYTLYVGNAKARVAIAATKKCRNKGLMFRKSLPKDQGMLFVFPRPDILCFWMKNTFIPLDIAFISKDGSIRAIKSMQPHSTRLCCSGQEVMYALEMNKGWFATNTIRVGQMVKFTNISPEALQAR